MTWLDRSAAALAIARARAEARGLTNIVWEQRSLLDLPGSGLGPFDYIDCCGVLHHLPDPAEGLRALLSVLAPGGGMGLMVYAPHGRTGVYMMQDALRRLAPPDETPQQRLDIARRVMKHLPETQWLRHNRNFDDHINGGDAGLVRPAAEPARPGLYGAGSQQVAAATRGCGSPVGWSRSATIRRRCCPIRSCAPGWTAMDPTERAALAEALAGNMAVHIVYCVRSGDPVHQTDPGADTSVPVFREVDGETLASGMRPDGTLPVTFDGLRTLVALPPLATAILPLIDGQRSVGQIGAILAGRGIKPEVFREGLAPDLRRAGADQPCAACRAALMLTQVGRTERPASVALKPG